MLNPEHVKKKLSARELTVLKLSASGMTDKEIAEEFKVSLGTVHTYWTRIRAKSLGKTRAQIIANFIRQEIAAAGPDGDPSRDRRQIQSLLNSIPQHALVINRAQQVEFANQPFLAHHGLAESQVLGKGISTVLKLAQDSPLESHVHGVLSRGEPVQWTNAHKDVFFLAPWKNGTPELKGVFISIFMNKNRG